MPTHRRQQCCPGALRTKAPTLTHAVMLSQPFYPVSSDLLVAAEKSLLLREAWAGRAP